MTRGENIVVDGAKKSVLSLQRSALIVLTYVRCECGLDS